MFKLNKKESKMIMNFVNDLKVTELKIRGNNYFIKPDGSLKEVIGYYCAKYLGFYCVEYFSVFLKHKQYSISRDIHELYPFVLASDFIKNEYDLLEILDSVRNSKYYNEDLILDILKMYIFDILFLNDDRNKTNWGVILKNNNYCLILFDHSNIFSILKGPIIQYVSKVENHLSLQDSVIKDLETFLNDCPLEYYEKLLDFIYKANISAIKRIFRDIENLYHISLDSFYLELYEQNYTKILEMLNKKRGIIR